ncbi:MAG: CPXCG motif-containing cysteine-rich protein [Planctomycetota bacterium]|nr:CPXCG motif-containing cysteine-rich protein [Planctomycetota bacterium]
MDETSEYICPSCGESIRLYVDPSAGANQDYVEDCPVCCRPNVIHVMFDRVGNASIAADSE